MTTLSHDWKSVPAGSFCVLLVSSRTPLVLLNTQGYEVADGDLILTSKKGNVLQIDAGYWVAVGTVEHSDGGSYVALERSTTEVAT